MKDLTASLEDYLEVIYNYTNLDRKIRAVDISKELKVTRASTAEAIKKLVNKNLISYSRYDTIALTEAGEQIAKKIVSKHETLQAFFENILGLTKEEATYNACKIEHIITDNAFEKITEYIKR